MLAEYRIQRLRGGWAVVWYEEGRRRRYQLQTTSRTRAEAEAEARDVVARLTRTGSDLTVADLWDAYRSSVQGRPVAEDLVHRGKAILPHFGMLRPDQITDADCRDYIKLRRSTGRQDGTIWSEMGSLRNCLSWAVRSGLIDRKPYILRPAKPAPKNRFLTREEVDRLLAVQSSPHVKLAMLLMLTTAARKTAVLELTWSQVDFDRRQIDLRKGSATRKGRAVVPINDSLLPALRDAYSARMTDHVVEWCGKPVSSIRTSFSKAARDAGLEGVSPHVLRHTAAVLMAEAGVPMDQISQYLGHSDTRITASVYARYSPSFLRNAARALEFGPQEPSRSGPGKG